MSAKDGRVVGTEKIVDHGPASKLLNIVLVAEGYGESQLGTFATHARQFVAKLFSTPPLDEYRCAINVYRIDVASTESGADDPAKCADKSIGSGVTRKTYFDASFCGGGVRRGISVDEGLVLNVVDQRVPEKHLVLVVVNSPAWGGMGGPVAKTTVAGGWEDIAIHEMGHTLFGLADEYEFYVGCGLETDRNRWPSFLGSRIEPAEANITIFGTRGNKWGSLVDPATAMPTTRNPDCTKCDPQPSPVPPRTVGAFEGGGSYHCDVFRAEYRCKMRASGNPFFCAVCERRIGQVMSPFRANADALAAPLPARFRQVNDYATAAGFRGGFPTFHEDEPGVQYGCILVKSGFADFEDVPAATLGNPATAEDRMRAVNDYAVARGYLGGFPTFHEVDRGAGPVYGCVLLKPAAGVWRDLRIAELSNPVGFEGRFQAVNDWAASHGFRSGIPNFHEADKGTLYECVFIKYGFADWADVPASDLGDPQTPEERFRAVNDYASARGYVGGFPNFHQADYGEGTVYGSILVKPSAAEWRDVFRSQLPGGDGFPDRIRAVDRWATARRHRGGLPNFHEAATGVVYGTILLKSGTTDWEDVPAATLGYPTTPEARMQAVNDYAVSKGYVGGFPNFHEANYGAGVVYGCNLLKASAAEWRDVRAAELRDPPPVGLEERFRATNDHAGKLGFFTGFPNFHESDPGPVYGSLLTKHGAADWQDVPRVELGHPSTPEERFRAANDYAGKHGYFAGLPNFHEALVGVVYGGIFFRSGSANWQDVSASDLGDPQTPEERFRAVNDYASARGYVGGFPNFHQAGSGGGIVYGCILIKQGYADWQDVPAATLGNPATAEDRMRAVNDYAVARGYVGGFPNFHEADYGAGTVYGCILVKPSAADWRDVRVADLAAGAGSFDGRFRAFNDYAGTIGFFAGLPNFHEADKGVVHGTILIKSGYADWQDVPAATLGDPTTPEARMQAVNDYAVSKGYVGGFPNFHEADYGAGVVYGCILLKASAAEWRDVRAADLGNPAGFEARFRAVNDWAGQHGFFSGFPNFHEARYGPYYGTIFLKTGAADWQDVPASALGNPVGAEARFRAVNDYAAANGYPAAFPNFHEADYGPVYGSLLFNSIAASRANIQAAALGDPSGPEARFRAVNDHAATLGYFAGYPTFRDTPVGVVYGSVLLSAFAADWSDVRASTLNNPATPEDRMRAVHDYAVGRGYAGGFPNFHQADYGRVYGTIVLAAAAADWEDVPAATLGNPATPEARMQAVNDYAVSKGYVGGFPNFHEANYGAGVVYGCILLKPAYADWADVPAAELGNPSGAEPRFRAVHDWAIALGYLGGFPNFHEADYGAGTVYGCILVKSSAGEGRHVPIRRLCA